MTNVLSDLKHGFRVLLRTPLFTICTIAALAIGIGATTALFSVVHALLIKPLPYKDADALVVMWEHNLPRNRPRNVISPANFLQWRERSRSFDEHGGVHAEPRDADRQRRTAGAGDASSSPPTSSTCSAWRRCSGADSSHGEDREGAPRTMILSHAAWLRQFGGDSQRHRPRSHDQRRARDDRRRHAARLRDLRPARRHLHAVSQLPRSAARFAAAA